MRRPVTTRRSVLTGALALAAAGVARAATAVSMLKADEGRDVRLSTWAAAGRERGVVLFSHGALSAPEKYERLLTPWSQAGFRILAPLHVDSTDNPDHARYGMIESWRARLLDMRAVAAACGADRYVAAGHSYGALTALTLGGAAAEVPPGITPPLRDPRARSVIAFSPPGPSPGLITAEGYAGLAVPALIETGDKDVPFGSTDGRWQVHLTAFDAAPPGDKYALVLEGADHYFGDLICRPERDVPPQTAAFARAVEVSTDFLEAYGAHDAGARRRLEGAISATGPAKLSVK